jgi:hypothetical protein
MATTVNLDALIPREDFLASDGVDAGASGKNQASRTDLMKGESFFLTLRKPDFQRETAAWTPEAVCEFIKAFIEGDLIPSVICWQSPARLSFVIDGAHRLSAIIAWLLDDYGDNEESVKFYNNNIPEEQRKIAQKTRALVNDTIGSYKDFRAETQNPGSNPKLTTNARALAHSNVPLLWVKGQDSKKAERAFLTINQSAVQIDPTELKLLNARFKPNAIAARAIVRNATGHKYWEKFSLGAQETIETLGREIYKALYSPELNPPIRTMDLPIAGHGYGSQTLPLIFDFVNIANGLPVIDASKAKRELRLIEQVAPDEAETLAVMKNASKLARRITGIHPSSLGLHPAVYFYSSSGRHQPTAVLAMAALLTEFERNDKFIQFSKIRGRFEAFLLSHKMFINQITLRYGSMAKGFRQLKEYYEYLIVQLGAGKSEEEIESLLKNHDRYQILVKEKAMLTKKPKAFSQATKQLVYINEALEKSFYCRVCEARIDTKSMHLDHDEDKKFGGLGTAANGRWLHPFCDSTFKDHIRTRRRRPSASNVGS